MEDKQFSPFIAYLGLKIGMTISASIPAAVFSMTIMKLLFGKGSILEHNLVQTMASVGEAIAASTIFVIPAFFFLGIAPSALEITCIILIGGVTGILFMIPMRRYVIVKEHGVLSFPEGTACAEILKAGEEKEHDGALLPSAGIVIGAIYKFFVSGIPLSPCLAGLNRSFILQPSPSQHWVHLESGATTSVTSVQEQ